MVRLRLSMPHIFREAGDLADDVRRMFDELAARTGPRVSGECLPPVDVLETADAVEIVVDLPGVRPEDVRIRIKGGTVLIVGEKPSTSCASTEATFHLVERGFGRFARVVRLTGAIDASRADATFTAGELRLVLPKIGDRRGREIAVPIRQLDKAP